MRMNRIDLYCTCIYVCTVISTVSLEIYVHIYVPTLMLNTSNKVIYKKAKEITVHEIALSMYCI